MSSLFKTTVNTRALPTGNMRFLRSDCPLRLFNEEVNWLLDNGTTTIVDLRTEEEAEQAPCRLEKEYGFLYLRRPVTVKGVPNTPEEMTALYIAMVDENLASIVDAILSAETNVLFFCGSGQDRTGVVSAALLKRLGYSDEVIINDYMETKGNLQPFYEAAAKKDPSLDLDLLLPNPENIQKVLNLLSK